MGLKHCLDQGMSKAEMARRFGVSERTIRRWVAAGQLDGGLTAGRVAYWARPPVPHRRRVQKTTFCQMMCKFQLGRRERRVGCLLATPQAVLTLAALQR